MTHTILQAVLDCITVSKTKNYCPNNAIPAVWRNRRIGSYAKSKTRFGRRRNFSVVKGIKQIETIEPVSKRYGLNLCKNKKVYQNALQIMRNVIN